MKKQILFLIFAIPLFCMAQRSLIRQYEYDAAGNRIARATIKLKSSTPEPSDSTEVYSSKSGSSEIEYFVEKMAQVEIKIYPNPTTEKITLEIGNMEQLQTGKFTLFSPTGQLLQDQPVHSITTIISLANLPQGAYILKVHINDRTEDWKVIKQ
jgi:hypothetical protein